MAADLKDYQSKRDFDRTPEPRAGLRAGSPRHVRFVIQKHRARHLHYDMRLEREGVLRSWAIPKEPPLVSGVKRLAVATEDHPLGYEEFEGEIPEGNYGAGTVEIWDRGSYLPVEWKEELIVFEVNAGKMSGTFCLVKLKPKEKDDKNWLFFKKQEERGRP